MAHTFLAIDRSPLRARPRISTIIPLSTSIDIFHQLLYYEWYSDEESARTQCVANIKRKIDNGHKGNDTGANSLL